MTFAINYGGYSPAQPKKIITVQCRGCDNTVPRNSTRSHNEGYFCQNCSQKYFAFCTYCQGCYRKDDPEFDIYEEHQGRWVCTECYAIRANTIQHRNYAKTIVGKGTGSIIQSDRGWSTEIECYVTNKQKIISAFAKLPNSFGVGRDGSLKNINHKTADGRILLEGIEITTPILKGKDGEQYITDLCNALNLEDNARVDATCGTHIHIDMNDVGADFRTMKNLLAFHWIYESVIMSFLPMSRRSSQYCQSLKNNYSIKKIKTLEDMDQLYELWYKNRHITNRYDKKHTRYHGINLHSVFEARHAEIRYHSGTTSAKKIMHWAALHTRIIDLCAGKTGTEIDENDIIKHGLTALGRSRSVTFLTKQMFALLQLNEETEKYLSDRQKKFKNAPQAREVEFIEKEDPKIYEIVPVEATEEINPNIERHFYVAGQEEPLFTGEYINQTLRRFAERNIQNLPETNEEIN